MSNTVRVQRRTDAVPIYQGDDAARIEELGRAVNEATTTVGAPGRLNDPSPAQAAADELDEFLQDALTRAVIINLQSLGGRAWRNLLVEHPAREDNDDDKHFGFNAESIVLPLLSHWETRTNGAIERTVTNEEFGNRDDLTEFLEDLNAGELDNLAGVAFRLNLTGSPNPKVSTRSLIDQTYAETLRRRAAED